MRTFNHSQHIGTSVWRSRKAFRVLQGSFSRKFNGCLREVLKLFQEFFKEVLWVFQGRLSGALRHPLRRFKGSSKVSKWNLKGVLREFLRQFQRVSSKFQISFMKFCFSIFVQRLRSEPWTYKSKFILFFSFRIQFSKLLIGQGPGFW